MVRAPFLQERSMRFNTILAAVAAATASSGALAATYTCDYSVGPDVYNASSIGMTCGAGPTVTTRGGLYEGGSESNTSNFDESGFSPSISRYTGSGLGVQSGNEEHTVDNYYGDEYVRFTFSAPVRVLSVTLSRIGDDLWGADADISYLVGALGSSWSTMTVNNPGELSNHTYTFASLAFSDLFRLGARFGESNDDFKIRSMTVETRSSVPLPGSLALIGLGLGAAGFATRRHVRR
jgi:hypothetical protein